MGMALPDAHRNLGPNGYVGPTAIEQVLEDVRDEVNRATRLHGPYRSLHEAYGVLVEEVDEFFDEVKLKSAEREDDRTVHELVQVAAVAVKTILCIREGFGSLERETAIAVRDNKIKELQAMLVAVGKAIGCDE